MPPKKKISKKEQRKIDAELKKAEELERLKKLEEEKAEQQRKDEEAQKKRKAEEELFNAAERERLKVEEKEFFHYENTLKNAIKKQLERFDAEQEWKKYLADPDHLNTNDPKQMAIQLNKLKFAFKEIGKQR
jgi:hypothetical protein